MRVLLREKLDLIIEDVHGPEDLLGESVNDPIFSVYGLLTYHRPRRKVTRIMVRMGATKISW